MMVQTVVVPVLCNLAACCIQLGEWNKAVSFGEQAVLLRPHCSKAQLRKGLGLLRLGEHELALRCFTLAQISASAVMSDAPGVDTNQQPPENISASEHQLIDKSVNDQIFASDEPDQVIAGSKNMSELSPQDWKRLPLLITQAKRGVMQQRQYVAKQKQSLTKAFAKGSNQNKTLSNTANEKESTIVDNKVELMSLGELLLFFVDLFFNFFRNIFRTKIE